MNTKQIRIRPSDLKLLRTTCKSLFINYHPEFKEEKLEDAFMLNKVIKFFIEG